MQSTSDYLHTWTYEYWHLSSVYQGRIKEKLSVGKAIRSANRILEHIGPDRKLRHYTNQLSHSIVDGTTSTIPTGSATIHPMSKTNG